MMTFGFLLVLGSQTVAAQTSSIRLAVLEFSGRNLEQDVLAAFSDAIRGGAVEGLGETWGLNTSLRIALGVGMKL